MLRNCFKQGDALNDPQTKKENFTSKTEPWHSRACPGRISALCIDLWTEQTLDSRWSFRFPPSGAAIGIRPKSSIVRNLT
jgi:hypothetical protein